ncbi:MAG: helix-turn-helix transcriptional regulator [Pseudomonadota bacterium]
MANNIKDLRLAFLLTPSQFASRLGVSLEQYRRLEGQSEPLAEIWIDAVAKALGVPTRAITDPAADITTLAAAKTGQLPQRERICPIGARFAIQALVAKLGGLDLAVSLLEEDLSAAVANLIAYTEDVGEDGDDEERLNRLSQALQITALTILQSHGVDPGPDLPRTMRIAHVGALSLLRSFSEVDLQLHDRGTG